MNALAADIAANPLGAILVLVGLAAALMVLAEWIIVAVRQRRRRGPGIPRAHLLGHGMNRTKYGRH